MNQMKKAEQKVAKTAAVIRHTAMLPIALALILALLGGCTVKTSDVTQTDAPISPSTAAQTVDLESTKETNTSTPSRKPISYARLWDDTPLKDPVLSFEETGNGIARLLLPQSPHYCTTVKEIYRLICDGVSGFNEETGGFQDNYEYMNKLVADGLALNIEEDPILPSALPDGISYSGSNLGEDRYDYWESHFKDRSGREMLTVRQSPPMDMIDCYYGDPSYTNLFYGNQNSTYTYYTFETDRIEGMIAEYPAGSPAAKDASALTVLIFDDGVYNFRLYTDQLSKEELIAAADSMGRGKREAGLSGHGADAKPGGAFTEYPVGYTYLYSDTLSRYTLTYHPEELRRIAVFSLYSHPLNGERQYPQISGYLGTFTPSGGAVYKIDGTTIIYRQSGLSQNIHIRYGDGVSFFRTAVDSNDALLYICESDGIQQEIGILWSDGQSDYQLIAHSAELSCNALRTYAESVGTGEQPTEKASCLLSENYSGLWLDDHPEGGFELMDLGDCYLLAQSMYSFQPNVTKNKNLGVFVRSNGVTEQILLSDDFMFMNNDYPVYFGCMYYQLIIPKASLQRDMTIMVRLYVKTADLCCVMKTVVQYDALSGSFRLKETNYE